MNEDMAYENISDLIAVGAHSCGHVSISFLHINPEEIALAVDLIAAHPDTFKAMLIDRVSQSLVASSTGVPAPHHFTKEN